MAFRLLSGIRKRSFSALTQNIGKSTVVTPTTPNHHEFHLSTTLNKGDPIRPSSQQRSSDMAISMDTGSRPNYSKKTSIISQEPRTRKQNSSKQHDAKPRSSGNPRRKITIEIEENELKIVESGHVMSMKLPREWIGNVPPSIHIAKAGAASDGGQKENVSKPKGPQKLRSISKRSINAKDPIASTNTPSPIVAPTTEKRNVKMKKTSHLPLTSKRTKIPLSDIYVHYNKSGDEPDRKTTKIDRIRSIFSKNTPDRSKETRDVESPNRSGAEQPQPPPQPTTDDHRNNMSSINYNSSLRNDPLAKPNSTDVATLAQQPSNLNHIYQVKSYPRYDKKPKQTKSRTIISSWLSKGALEPIPDFPTVPEATPPSNCHTEEDNWNRKTPQTRSDPRTTFHKNEMPDENILLARPQTAAEEIQAILNHQAQYRNINNSIIQCRPDCDAACPSPNNCYKDKYKPKKPHVRISQQEICNPTPPDPPIPHIPSRARRCEPKPNQPINIRKPLRPEKCAKPPSAGCSANKLKSTTAISNLPQSNADKIDLFLMRKSLNYSSDIDLKSKPENQSNNPIKDSTTPKWRQFKIDEFTPKLYAMNNLQQQRTQTKQAWT